MSMVDKYTFKHLTLSTLKVCHLFLLTTVFGFLVQCVTSLRTVHVLCVM